MSILHKNDVIKLLQKYVVVNSLILGWNIRQIGPNKFELNKKIDKMTILDNNTKLLLSKIIAFDIAKS